MGGEPARVVDSALGNHEPHVASLAWWQPSAVADHADDLAHDLCDAVVLGREKHFGAPVAALCHVVRQTGNDNAGKASHAVNLHAAIARRTG